MIDEISIDFSRIPKRIPEKSVLCIAKPASLTEYALPLRIIDRYADKSDCRIIVTSSVSAEETIRQHNEITTSSDICLGVIDTNDQRSSLYQENPRISIPHLGDLVQLDLAIDDLQNTNSTSCSETHVIFRSLTPVLSEAHTEPVANLLRRVSRRTRSNSGHTIFGIEYTKHSEETVALLEKLADGIIWVEQTSPQNFRFEYQRTRF